MNLLNEIITNKRIEIEARKKEVPLAQLKKAAEAIALQTSFINALRSAPMGLIAEVKRRSPSAGNIREPFNAVEIARAYEQAGAQALSVLMDEKYFGGGEADFKAVRQAVKIPLLYKEFVVDEWQVWHARKLGASAILLIVAALSSEELQHLHKICREAQIEPLVEVHTEDEARVAMGLGTICIGVNNRDLKTFKVSLDTTFLIQHGVPSKFLLISESGIKTAQDVAELRSAGVKAILVGEHLLRQSDIGKAVRQLMGGV